MSFEEQLTQYFSAYNIIWDEWELNEKYSKNTIVVLRNIHQTKKQTKNWDSIINGSSVRLSIDLYDYGLLFFKDEFIEKQHFILKR